MLTITIKNIPPELYDQIKTSAQLHRRSINSEVLTRLEEALGSKRVNPDTFLNRLDALQKELTLPYLTDDALEDIKSEGRE